MLPIASLCCLTPRRAYILTPCSPATDFPQVCSVPPHLRASGLGSSTSFMKADSWCSCSPRATLSASRRLITEAMRPKQKDRKKPPITMVTMHHTCRREEAAGTVRVWRTQGAKEPEEPRCAGSPYTACSSDKDQGKSYGIGTMHR